MEDDPLYAEVQFSTTGQSFTRSWLALDWIWWRCSFMVAHLQLWNRGGLQHLLHPPFLLLPYLSRAMTPSKARSGLCTSLPNHSYHPTRPTVKASRSPATLLRHRTSQVLCLESKRSERGT